MSVAVSHGPAAGRATRPDPFNWPSLNRADCMTLQTLDVTKDIMATKTINHRHKSREMSHNLNSRDIEGNNRFN